jgi:hypothetical protein
MKPICWLRITDYIRDWARVTLGTPMRVKNKPILDILSLEGIRPVLLLPAENELPGFKAFGNAMCDTWYAALTVGVEMDAWGMEKEFGITKATLDQYLPVLCPSYAVAENGAVRIWDSDTSFGKQQTTTLLRLIRDVFWSSVGKYATEYRKAHFGAKYAQIDMLESFCKDYHINDMHLEAMRREWQRRCKREK